MSLMAEACRLWEEWQELFHAAQVASWTHWCAAWVEGDALLLLHDTLPSYPPSALWHWSINCSLPWFALMS